jgi:hypothetical protein
LRRQRAGVIGLTSKLRSLARALNIDIGAFDAPTPQERDRLAKDLERAKSKMLLVRTRPIRTLADFRREFGARHAMNIDSAAVEGDEAIDTAAGLTDLLKDLGDVWDDVYESERVEYGRTFVEQCDGLQALGYTMLHGKLSQALAGARKA